jgi:hypothetical protein
LLLASAESLAQVATSSYPGYRPPGSYASYYNQQLQTYNRPPSSAGQYITDTYFYHRPTVSPYLNLLRRSGPYVNNYFQYVQPEIQRRQQLSASGLAGPSSTVEPRPQSGNAYYNQWYAQRREMGLP